MSLDGTYDDGNIFAKILRGEAPAARVFEDEHVYAFMDVFPQSRGHTLVIPKHSQARNLLDEEPGVLSELILGVQRVARAVRAALKPDGSFAQPDEIESTRDEPGHQDLCDREQRLFLKAIRGEADLSEHHRDAIHSLRIVFAADESMRTGQAVKL